MYIIGDQKISLSEANALAKEFDTTVEELATSGGWQLEGGKTTVPEGYDSTDGTRKEDGRWGFQFGRYFIGVTRANTH